MRNAKAAGIALSTLALIFSVATTTAAFDITSGRVVHYSFDDWISTGRALDLSGKRNHGTLVNFDQPPVTEGAPTGSGRALVFDRSRKQRIDVGTGAQRSLDLSTFTIAAWIRITEPDTEERNWEIAEKTGAYWLNVRNGHDSLRAAYRLRCGLVANGVQYALDSEVRVPHDGSWVHVAGTYNGRYLRVYINGIRRGSRAVSGQLAKNDDPMTVGANNKPMSDPVNPIHNWMMGAMDDFRLYNRPLTTAEIAALATR